MTIAAARPLIQRCAIQMTKALGLAVAAVVVVGTTTVAPAWPASPPPPPITGVVVAVHDADTFTLANKTKIRVFGVDAPELRQQCRLDAIHEPGPSPCVPCGEQARQALERLIIGKEVTCTDRGKSYDRIVGECAVGKIQVGPWLLSHGWAVVYDSFLRKADRPAYIGAQSGAKRANEGIWAMTWVPPARWRKRARLECER